jgi:hypothetical protein
MEVLDYLLTQLSDLLTQDEFAQFTDDMLECLERDANTLAAKGVS